MIVALLVASVLATPYGSKKASPSYKSKNEASPAAVRRAPRCCAPQPSAAAAARDGGAPRVDRRCISAFGYCSCTVCVLEPLLGTEDPWAPERFADATSCHMQQVRRATRKALYRQLQRSDVRRSQQAPRREAWAWIAVHHVRHNLLVGEAHGYGLIHHYG